jgi:hypothetical protein
VGSLKAKIKHAFAVDPPGSAEPTPEQQVPVDWMCQLAARKHMTTPALIALEMCRPLNWIGAQSLHFFRPAVWAVTPERLFANYKNFASFLENRGSIDYMLRRVEHWETHFKALESGESAPEDATDEHDNNA